MDEFQDGTRPRRRVSLRKGAGVDEELWPAEAFGGVSDEQFWDDLASDKPLTTTARTAQQEPEARKRQVDTGHATDPQMLRVTRPRIEDRGRGDSKRSPATGGYPEARTGPDLAAERTMIQPAYTATQPVPAMTSQAPSATQATRETRGRRRPSSDEEDPLTSAAFALRTSGPVDGRSALRAGEPRSAGSGPGSGSGYGGPLPAPVASRPAAYPSHRTSYGDPSPASTPPSGENHDREPVSPGEHQRTPNGSRSHARHADEGTPRVRQAYPQDSYPAGNRQGTRGPRTTGSYPTAGYPPGGYQGSGGYPGPSQRAPYDPGE